MKCELYNDSMQNWKSKPIQKAQLIIADVPYNVGNNFYGSNPMWYVGGTTRMAKASWQARRHLRAIIHSTCSSISIFAPDL